MSLFRGRPVSDAEAVKWAEITFHQVVAAIDAGDVERLQRLLHEHPSLATDRLEMIDALVDAGAALAENPNNALVNGHVAAAAHLLSRGAIMTLGAALCLDRWDDAERLDAEATPKIQQFSLVLACLNGKSVGVRWILARGASPHEPSADLFAHGTPLHHAVCSGSLDTVKALVAAGFAVRHFDRAGRRGLHEDAVRLSQGSATASARRGCCCTGRIRHDDVSC